MTVKEASIRFDLDEKEIRKRQRDNMIIGIRKDGRSVVIPDNTEIIPSKSEVRSFLFQILKKRNNVETIISRSLARISIQPLTVRQRRPETERCGRAILKCLTSMLFQRWSR